MPVEFTPPRVAVVIDKHTYSCEQALASGMLALSIPGRAMADLTYTVGCISGRDLGPDTDKFAHYGIESVAGPALGLPLVAGAIAWMECRVLPEPRTQALYDTVFLEVVSAQADERVFADGRWSLRADNHDLHTVHHLGAGLFAVAGDPIQGTILPPR